MIIIIIILTLNCWHSRSYVKFYIFIRLQLVPWVATTTWLRSYDSPEGRLSKIK
jgi:hypothetical protein